MWPLSRALFPGLAPHFLGTVPSPRDVSAEYTDLHKAPNVISLILFCLTTPGYTVSSVIVITIPRAGEEAQDLTLGVSLISACHFSCVDLGEIALFGSLKPSFNVYPDEQRPGIFFYNEYTTNYHSFVLTLSLLRSNDYIV